MPTSPDTLLRPVKGADDGPAPSPRFVGVDDWAVRKGQRYVTVLIDLERGRVIDILEGRDGAALKTWLTQHPGVEVITRGPLAGLRPVRQEALKGDRPVNARRPPRKRAARQLAAGLNA
jgi:hypothetical protein